MAKIRIAAAVMSMTAIAMASTASFAQDAEAEAALMNAVSAEGVVTSSQTCEYEGGSVIDLDSGKICFIAVRGEALNTKIYDGQALGVIKCSGNGAYGNELVQPSGEFCRVYLEQKKVAPSRAEVEAQTRASMKAEELETETTN